MKRNCVRPIQKKWRKKKQMGQRRKKKFYLNTFDKKGQGHIGMQLSAAWAWTLQLLLLIWTQVEPHWMCVWNRMWTVLCVNQQPEFSWCETRSTPSPSTSQLQNQRWLTQIQTGPYLSEHRCSLLFSGSSTRPVTLLQVHCWKTLSPQGGAQTSLKSHDR